MTREPVPAPADHSIIETLQSLVLAFVLAMTFRGFVTEGFVIPTGSMAPTLMGRHVLAHSPQTGATYPVGVDESSALRSDRLADPMLGPHYEVPSLNRRNSRPRMGDRILVLKSLYPFAEPDRFDVVVFKNPTNPNGDDGNYIKRLVGLPNESILLIDGDVFVGSADAPDAHDDYAVQRKPAHVQRAVWQPVAHSDYRPEHPDDLWIGGRPVPYGGPPWSGDAWTTEDVRAYRTDTAEPTELRWNLQERPLDDWTPYNMLLLPDLGRDDLIELSDVRVAAGIAPSGAGLRTTFELEARSHLFQFELADGRATVRMRPVAGGDADWIERSAELPASGSLRGGDVTNVEFWHVDQVMALYVNDERVVELPYEWSILERLQHSTGLLTFDDYNVLLARPAVPPALRWRFEGAPVALHRVRVDRDLFYRADRYLGTNRNNPVVPEYEDLVIPRTAGFGTHVDKPAILGPDHFFMLGDNSPASLDSRRWGSPHPLVAEQIEPMPFVVHRRLLLGKAWVVYFPAPYRVGADGRLPVVPDFGRLRFIR